MEQHTGSCLNINLLNIGWDKNLQTANVTMEEWTEEGETRKAKPNTFRDEDWRKTIFVFLCHQQLHYNLEEKQGNLIPDAMSQNKKRTFFLSVCEQGLFIKIKTDMSWP